MNPSAEDIAFELRLVLDEMRAAAERSTPNDRFNAAVAVSFKSTEALRRGTEAARVLSSSEREAFRVVAAAWRSLRDPSFSAKIVSDPSTYLAAIERVEEAISAFVASDGDRRSGAAVSATVADRKASGQKGADSVHLTPGEKRAWQQYQAAEEAMSAQGEEWTDAQAYAHAKDDLDSGEQLPKRGTWERQLRGARKKLGLQKKPQGVAGVATRSLRPRDEH